MSNGRSTIFLLDAQNNEITPLLDTEYAQEEHLQELLARCPALLAGGGGAKSARYLLISREMPVPDSAYSGGRWSLDHLFIDQDAIPTFVECKRGANNQSRREVVAQMLDYAANGSAYWQPGHFRSAFEQTCSAQHESAEDLLAKHLTADVADDARPQASDEFWAAADRNLRDRRIRLIFVADKIPEELKRLVEFLNEEMNNVEVLAMEIRHYRVDGYSRSVLVPEVVGATSRAQAVKDRPRRNVKDPDSFLEEAGQSNAAARPFYEDLWDDIQAMGGRHDFTPSGFTLRIPASDPNRLVTVAFGFPDYFQYYVDIHVLKDPQLREKLRDQIVQDSGGPFEKKGAYTVTVKSTAITEANKETLRKAFIDAVQRLVEELAKSGSQP
jgi:hypothetical protein